MKQFFKFMFASMLGTFLTMIVVMFIFLGIIGSMIAFSKKEIVTVQPNSILHIKLDGIIQERTPANPFANFDFNKMESKNEPGLNDIIACIGAAKNDPNIKGVFLDLSTIQAGMASVEEIRNALIDFKTSGKFIYSYSEVYSQKAYYLATVSDKIYLNSQGMVDFRGLGAELMFYKGLLQKLDVEIQVVRHGKFKSAVEPFILDKMSAANREQTREFIGSIWQQFVKGISETRKISEPDIQNIADNMLVQDAEGALKYKFVDSLIYKDQMLDILKNKVGTKHDPGFVALADYKRAVNFDDDKKFTRNRIAVIYAYGNIVSGEGTDESIGSLRISNAIRNARLDTSIRAIVLRVNSPGGDALASDIIWREVVLAKNVKPVVVSMGDYAASGGYYIACGATKIVANPNTITGSIGVFGIIPNLQKMFSNKLGITFDTIQTNKNSIYLTGRRPMTAYQEMMLQREIEHIYKTFITHVAEGRKMTVAEVDSIGQGRVWSGTDAKRIGLIDEFGGMDVAVAEAAKLAKLDKYKVVEYPKQKMFFNQLMEAFTGASTSTLLEKELGQNYVYYKALQTITDLKGVQARLPFVVNFN